LSSQNVKAVVEDWLFNSQFEDGDCTMADALHDSPEMVWSAILQLLEVELADRQVSLLAAGPLEDLLALYGSEFIERVELEARRNSRFNNLLGGVWQNKMSMEIWERVQKARKEVW
jgi:hypothetical protein